MFVCCTGTANGSVVHVVKTEEALEQSVQEDRPEPTSKKEPDSSGVETSKAEPATKAEEALGSEDEKQARISPRDTETEAIVPPTRGESAPLTLTSFSSCDSKVNFDRTGSEPGSPSSPKRSALKKKSVTGQSSSAEDPDNESPISRGRSTMFKEEAEVVAIPDRAEVLKAKAEQLKADRAALGASEIANHYQTINRTSTVHALQLAYIANPGKLWDDDRKPKNNNEPKEAEVRKSVLPTCLGPAGLRDSKGPEGNIVSGPDDKLEEHYDIGEKIGTGAFGTIFKCTSKPGGQEFCLKKVKMSTVEEAGQLKMFNAEIAIEAKLQHPNISWLEHVFRDEDHVCFVMELLSGGDLFGHLANKNRKMGLARTAAILWQLISAAAYLHHNRIAHRDIRPENCIFESGKAAAQLKLIDFGLARTYEKGKPMTSVVGAIGFVAPEVLSGSYSEKCDIWSVGVISFLTCTGFLPIYEESDERWAVSIMKGNVNWGAMISSADARIRDVIMSMLTVNGENRPTAASFADNAWLRKTATTPPKDCTVQ